MINGELNTLCEEIIKSLEQWKDINDHGCNDPFWEDGCNMNLVRNHIIYFRRQIEDICIEKGLVLPEEYYLPIPPAVDEHYMANLRQKERVERLRQMGRNLTTKKTKFEDDGQLRFA